jgi:hypothetical protein
MKAYDLGFKYGMLIVDSGAELEDVTTDFGVPYVQSDFKEELAKENIEITDEFIEDNLTEIEEGYHAALEKIGFK